ncbi:MAG TPA: AraC family transcriptional regulator [Planctomycetota bacterium]|nr:AraC family transcriptional regulator [Planctomycetota bacterium]
MSEVQHEHVLGAWFFFTVRGRLPLLHAPLHVVLDPEERLVAYVRHMYELQQSGGPGEEQVRDALALTFVTEILAAAQRGGRGTPDEPWRIGVGGIEGKPVPLLALVDEAVEKRLKDQIAIDDVAEALRMSVSSLAHRFKAETGMTVMERVRWLRIREARRLLARPGATVKSVARDLAFCSPFHLSRLFREITGATPQEWIQRNRG